MKCFVCLGAIYRGISNLLCFKALLFFGLISGQHIQQKS